MLAPAVLGTIRTLVPALVGSALLWLANVTGADLSELADVWIVALTGVITALYYALVTFLERKVHPMFGILLGFPKAPEDYQAKHRAA